MKPTITILSFFLVLGVNAQQKTFTLDWVDRMEVSAVEGTSTIVPGFEGIHFNYNQDTKSISFNANWKTQGFVSGGELRNVSYETISPNLLKNIDLSKIPSRVEFSLQTGRARNQLIASLHLNPLVNDNGTYKKITSFTLSFSASAGRLSGINNVPGIMNSVLATGDWFRFYVEKTGVFKIDRNFLQNLGMDVSSIDPQRLKIYGHGGQMLPLLNSANDAYDLPQVSIQVVDGGDGSFDSGDYILFYGIASTSRYNRELEYYNTHVNLYAERSYYYITADGDTGKRIFPFTQPSGSPDVSISTYDDYQFYEVDEYSLGKAGRRWFGDRFDIENERSYEFDFSNLVPGEPIHLEVLAAATAETDTSLDVSLNGQNAGTLSFTAIDEHNLARDAQLVADVSASSVTVTVDLTYNNAGSPSSIGYLDFIALSGKRLLKGTGEQFGFQYDDAATMTGIGQYSITNASGISQIWDVTSPRNITSVSNDGASTISFKAFLGETRKYVAVSDTDFYVPGIEANARVENQNLKGTIFESAQNNFRDIDYIIITDELLSGQANRLAEYRRNTDGLNVKVVLLETIYEEFNSGKPGIAAIRNFVAYVYHNASSTGERLKYLCLFGDASVDYKDRLPGNNNIVPTYESYSSLTVSSTTFASDDFYGMMGDGEGSMATSDLLDIAIGRIIADTPELARIAIDKTIEYETKESYGSWRNNFVLLADDADEGSDYGLQVTLDNVAMDLAEKRPYVNTYKIYPDAYQQESSAGGERYPEVNEDIAEAIERGALVFNYLGHGGEDGLAQERLIKKDDIESWVNPGKYPVFVIVTCEFTKFDNPLRPTGGEYLLWQEDAGAVASIATTRSIGVGSGSNFNEELAPRLFEYNQNSDDSVAEVLRKTKNNNGSFDKRVIFYFGDPAMKLAIPEPKISLTNIHDALTNQPIDTMEALDHVRVSGRVTTPSGALYSDYDGVLSTVIFDKRIDRQTLNNDGQGTFDFRTLGETIFRGQATVDNGLFEFEFVVPKDIAIPIDTGRVSFYAEKNKALEDQTGFDMTVSVGGINEDAPEDNIGPEIKLYMNDENFVSGGITNDSPFLLAKLYDANGINTASGIGHDLVAILDGDETNPYVVNDYYETELDDYTRGTVYYKLRDLEPGLHTLTFKAWDVYNNSSTAEIQFVVAGDGELKITRVLNYPNPFHNYTEFWFNHNRPFEPLQVQVQVFTVSGKVVWTENRMITTDGFLSREITWDGRDDFGQAIGKGVYVYKLTVKSTLTNDKVEKYEKLVIL
jgi:hypothetical protein